MGIGGTGHGPTPSEPTARRRERLAALVADRPFVHVTELSSLFGVSEVTVRSDLRALHRVGAVRRVPGGAVPPVGGTARPAGRGWPPVPSGELAAVAAAAAELVVPGDTVVLDNSPGMPALAAALLGRTALSGVTAVVLGLEAAALLAAGADRYAVLVPGGPVRPGPGAAIDPPAGSVLDDLVADLVFLGADGVDAAAGVTRADLGSAGTGRRVLAAGRRTVVLVGGAGVGRRSTAPVCGLRSVDLCVTGASADPDALRQLRAAGLSLAVAPPAAD